MQRSWQKSLSLAFQGSRRQIGVAALLLGGFPLLGLSFVLFVILRGDGAYSPMTLAVVVGLCAVLGLSGYAILWKYPKNIEKLRWYLRNIASGELPEKIALLNSEDDIKAIEKYLTAVLNKMRQKMKELETQLDLSRKMQKAIRSQTKQIVEAERHRAMIHSLGAACHHIGQPATVLRAHLHLLKEEASSEKVRDEIDQCVQSVETISKVLEKLREVSEYRTVPYVTHGGELPREDEEILDIDGADQDKSPPAGQNAIV